MDFIDYGIQDCEDQITKTLTRKILKDGEKISLKFYDFKCKNGKSTSRKVYKAKQFLYVKVEITFRTFRLTY